MEESGFRFHAGERYLGCRTYGIASIWMQSHTMATPLGAFRRRWGAPSPIDGCSCRPGAAAMCDEAATGTDSLTAPYAAPVQLEAQTQSHPGGAEETTKLAPNSSLGS